MKRSVVRNVIMECVDMFSEMFRTSTVPETIYSKSVVHSFTGTRQELKTLLDLNFNIGLFFVVKNKINIVFCFDFQQRGERMLFKDQ